MIGVEDHLAVDVARGAADGLHQRRLGAQKTFLVGVEDRDQRAFGDVEPFAQKVDADQHVEGAEAQVADDLDALDRVDVGMHVAHPDAVLVQIFGQVLGHALGQHGDQRAIAALRHLLHLGEQVVDLAAGRADLDRRVDQAGRADHLLDEDACRSAPAPNGPASPRRETVCGRIASHSSKRSGRLSMHEGRRKPYSASVALRR